MRDKDKKTGKRTVELGFFKMDVGELNSKYCPDFKVIDTNLADNTDGFDK